MKQKILALITCIALLISTFLTGCSPTPLETPTGLRVSGDKLTWNYVDSASGYILNIDGIEYRTGENYYSFSNITGLVNGETYNAMVKSKGDGYLKLNSEYSSAITFTYTSNNNSSEQGEKTTITESEKNQILSNTNTSKSYYGVGRTINVLTDEYANFTAESVGTAKVFDNDKLLKLNWYKEFVGDMESTSYKGTSMSEFYTELNVDFKKSLNASAAYSIFSATAENSFGFSAGASYTNTSNEIFYTASQYFGANLVAIDEYYDIRQFKNVLSEKFLNDINAIQNGNMSAQELINLYGTHAIVAGYFGGKISYNYYLNNKSTKWSTNVGFDYSNKVGAAVEGILSASTETSLSIAAKLGQNIEVSEERFSAKAIGGESFKADTLAEYKENYGAWVNAMNNPAIEKNVIVGLPQKSLIPIWELLPEEYANAKQIISNYFNSLADNVNEQFLSKYQRHYEEPKAPSSSTAIDYQTLSCKLDNGFNHNSPATETDAKFKHDHFKLGYFNITNANVENNSHLEIISGYNSSIAFVLGYNTTNLPTAGACTQCNISDDALSNNFFNLPYNIGNQKVGYGLIIATVTYTDGTPQHRVLITNAFKNKKMAESITIIDSVYLQKDCTVNIAILYELQHWAPGFLGISDDYWTNWRINKTFTIDYK